MPRGSRPGERRGKGRKGIPNRSTTARGKRISELARQYTDEAFETLLFHMRNKKKTPELSLRATEAILAYGHGKPLPMEVERNENEGVTTIVIRGGLPI